jgi:hypothetical protein
MSALIVLLAVIFDHRTNHHYHLIKNRRTHRSAFYSMSIIGLYQQSSTHSQDHGEIVCLHFKWYHPRCALSK